MAEPERPIVMKRLKEYPEGNPGEFQLRHTQEPDTPPHLRIVYTCPRVLGRVCGVPLKPHPNGWDWNGDKERPTLAPSLHCLKTVIDSAGIEHPAGCGWHGFITNGVMIPV